LIIQNNYNIWILWLFYWWLFGNYYIVAINGYLVFIILWLLMLFGNYYIVAINGYLVLIILWLLMFIWYLLYCGY
jgi:hypothetical protein